MKEGERKGRDGRRRKDDDIDTIPDISYTISWLQRGVSISWVSLLLRYHFFATLVHTWERSM
jgi:hypothetical protein